MDNLSLYNRFASVPKEAQKSIQAGRLKGMTDINPMWRIKCLTEAFGPEGVGWVAPITDVQYVPGAGGEVACTVTIELRYTQDGEWSKGVTGVGGSMFVANERNGLHTNDEALKMAYTDAISVACKGLGMGADIYWQQGRTKYSDQEQPEEAKVICEACGGQIAPTIVKGQKWSVQDVVDNARKLFGGKCMCYSCQKAEYAKMKERANENTD